jgi:hypothetical protein
VVLREGDEAREQLGPAQPWRRRRSRPADGDVISAARSRGASVEQVALGGEPRFERDLEHRVVQLGHLAR